MNKNKLKRYIIIALVVLTIVLISFIVSRIYFTSRNYIISLLNKGDRNVNYSISYSNDELIEYVKGFEEKLIFSDGRIYYANYKSGESILINPKNKTIELDRVEKKDGSHNSLYIKDINNMNFEYEGIKEVNSAKCIVVKLYENENNNYLMKKIYINKSLGIIEKIEKYKVEIYEDDKLDVKNVYNMHTGEVSDKDIEKPDLSKYLDYTTIDNK